jgi:mannose-1-phosphate guanylyltransferase/phosphomannomutase
LKAVIMAGGEGSRLRPLTCALPKPMVPVLNRPCMEHIIYLLRQHNIDDIAVTLQYLPEEIKSYFGDGKEYGVNLTYFTEDTPLGTAGSVKNAAAFLDETFVVISGDALTDSNLQKAFEFHREKQALATLVLTTVTCPLEYGVVITDGQGKIMRFLEKPGWGEVFSDTVNTGIYILEPEILDYVDENKMVDFSKDLFPRLLAAGKPLYAFVTEGYWCDIGNVEQYRQAQFDILNNKGTLLALPSREISSEIWIGDNARVDASAELIPPLVIGNDCVIGPNASIGPMAVIGDGVQIGQGSSLKKCVLWDGVMLGDKVELRGAVLGKAVRLLSAARVFEGSVIGDRCVVGEGSIIKPGVKIWPEKWVEKGTRLSKSLVWGNCGRSRLFGNRGIIGDLFTEISPDFACCLGLALGSSVEQEGRLSLAFDGCPQTQVIKNAILSGLISTGLQVVDLGKITLPVHRYGINAFNLVGGIHIHRVGYGKINICLMNSRGVDYSRGEQRKVEGLLSREEYRFASVPEIRSVEYLPGVNRSYLDHLLEFFNRDLIRTGRYRIVVDYDPGQLGALLPGLFDDLGCQLITFAASRTYSQNFSELLKSAEQFSEVVPEHGANFGAVLDSSGEEVVLVDEQGRIVSEDRLFALLSMITMESNQNSILALPVTAPESVVEMAQKQGRDIRRTKAAPWAIMETLLEDDVRASQQRCPQFLLYNDALAVLTALTEFLARRRRPLSEVLAEIPSFVTVRKDVEVDWDDKGKVLRHLAEEYEKQNIDTAEGIKIQHPQGWAMVLPDAEEPVCRVYSEAFNQEAAESLTDMYVTKIQEICQK